MKKDFQFEAPPGRMIIQAMREEALIDEKNEKPERAARWRNTANKMDVLTDIMKKGRRS
jgi:hypothetical protein